MGFQATVIKEQGVTFATVVVKRSDVDRDEANRTITSFQRRFPGMPIVLMA